MPYALQRLRCKKRYAWLTCGGCGMQVDGFGAALAGARKPSDRYGGAVNESGGYNPV